MLSRFPSARCVPPALHCGAAATGCALRASAGALLVGVLAGAGAAAHADRPPPIDDPISVPELAVEVNQVRLAGDQKWVPLNRRMLLVSLGTKDYLFVFDSTCAHLMRNDAVISTRTSGTTLYARDLIHVATGVRGTRAGAMSDALGATGDPCRIDRMYSILAEDWQALHEQFGR